MKAHHHPVRALCMFSGGLDSQLALCLMRRQGILVRAVLLESPFSRTAEARAAARRLQVPLDIVDASTTMIQVFRQWHSRNKQFPDPSLDYRRALFERMAELLDSSDAHFVCTGEVLDQHLPGEGSSFFEQTDAAGPFPGWIVRPLSGRRLPATEAQRRGWIRREHLLSIEGRSRKSQFVLAREFGLDAISGTSEWFRIAEERIVKRIRDLGDHEGLHGIQSLRLLSMGRHFRLGRSTKTVTGRNEEENALIESLAELYDYVLKTDRAPGPTALLSITATEQQLDVAASICVHYSDHKSPAPAPVRIRCSGSTRIICAASADKKFLETLRI